MEKLMNSLIAQGYNAIMQGNRIKIKLGGIANSVYIAQDTASNRFILKTREAILAVVYIVLLFAGINGADMLDNSLSAVCVVIAIGGLFSILLTELKSQQLRQTLNGVNSGETHMIF